MKDIPYSGYERHASTAEPVGVSPRRSYSLLLLLLLLAVLLFAWYSLIQRQQAVQASPTITPATEPVVSAPTPATSTDRADRSTRTARAERSRAAATRLRSAAPERILSQSPAPAYPATALRRGEGGTVLLRVNVGADGRPQEIAFADRSGSRELDRAARDAVSRWRFTPALENGKPVAAVVEVPVDFRPQQ